MAYYRIIEALTSSCRRTDIHKRNTRDAKTDYYEDARRMNNENWRSRSEDEEKAELIGIMFECSVERFNVVDIFP